VKGGSCGSVCRVSPSRRGEPYVGKRNWQALIVGVRKVKYGVGDLDENRRSSCRRWRGAK
jgi:hypothetical protein